MPTFVFLAALSFARDALAAPSNFVLGDFKIVVHEGPSTGAVGPLLQVLRAGGGTPVLSSLSGGAPFLQLSAGAFSAAEDEGNFAVVDEPLPLTDVQTVATASQPTARAVVVTGALTGGDVEKPTTFGSYAFTLRLCDAPAETCEPGTLAFSAKLSLATAVADPARLVLVWGSPESDSAFGFGEQYTHLDMKGRRVPVLVSEQGVGRGLQPVTGALGGAGGSWHTTYAPLPYFMRCGSLSQSLLHEVRVTQSVSRASQFSSH
jgi:hypothetical protein